MGFTPGHIDRALEAVPDTASRTIDNLISYMIDNPITEDEVSMMIFFSIDVALVVHCADLRRRDIRMLIFYQLE